MSKREKAQIISKVTPDYVQEALDRMSARQREFFLGAIKEVKNWQERYDDVAKANNYNVDIIKGILQFLHLQSGILYTAITGNVKCDDPLKELSIIELRNSPNYDSTSEDLNYMRNGLIIFTKKLEENGNINEAQEAWQNYIKGGNKK